MTDSIVAKISTLAPHFGVPMTGQGNTETEMTPIIGLDSKDVPLVGEEGSFTASQPPRLVQVIAKELSLDQPENIVGWELELYNYEPARTIGLDHELISAGRIDDKLCSWSAMEALIASSTENASSGVIKLVALFDNEEIGSQTRQGAKGTFLPSTIARVVETFAKGDSCNALAATQANSFLLSADVVHAGHPNFVHVYEAAHTPRLNVGLGIHWNGQGHMATDGVSAAFMEQIAHRVGQKMQYFIAPNDRRSGGTIGPMLSTQMGCRAVDVGAPMLGMHSVRSTTGALDPGLGVQIYKGFFDEYEDVDRLFAQ